MSCFCYLSTFPVKRIKNELIQWSSKIIVPFSKANYFIYKASRDYKLHLVLMCRKSSEAIENVYQEFLDAYFCSAIGHYVLTVELSMSMRSACSLYAYFVLPHGSVWWPCSSTYHKGSFQSIFLYLLMLFQCKVNKVQLVSFYT